MKRNLTLAAIGFALGAVYCYFNILGDQILSWKHLSGLLWAFFYCLTAGFATSFPGVLYDVLMRRGAWNERGFRRVFIPLLGASIGLLLLVWVALGDSLWEMCGIAGSLFADPEGTVVPSHITAQEYNLLERVHLIAFAKIIVEQWFRYAIVYAAIALAGVSLYERIKPRWYTVAIFIGLMLPTLVSIAMILQHPEFLSYLGGDGLCRGMVTSWYITGMCASVGLIAIMWTVREGWWKRVQPETVSAATSKSNPPPNDDHDDDDDDDDDPRILISEKDHPPDSIQSQSVDGQTINVEFCEEPILKRRKR